MYGTAERMNGRTRLHRCWDSIPVNNGTRIEGILVRVSGRIKVIICMSVREYGTGAGIMPLPQPTVRMGNRRLPVIHTHTIP